MKIRYTLPKFIGSPYGDSMEKNNEISLIDVPSKTKVNNAGKIIANREQHNAEDLENAYCYFNQWRSLHLHPIETLKGTFRSKIEKLGLKESTIVARRLKREPSIIFKLQRFKHMRLSQMQDIAGLRIIVSKISDVYRVMDGYRTPTKQFPHIMCKEDHYINEPKEDGYRSLHQIFQYKSKKHEELHCLTIEIQIRTKLQHQWATAVEILGTSLNMLLKNGQGEERYREFFRLCSTALAEREKTPWVKSHYGLSVQEIHGKIKQLDEELKILTQLSALAVANNHVEKIDMKKTHQFLITLKLDEGVLSIQTYSKAEVIKAQKQYAEKEELIRRENLPWDVLLASVDDIKNIKKAFPNYYLDSREFVKTIRSIISKA